MTISCLVLWARNATLQIALVALTCAAFSAAAAAAAAAQTLAGRASVCEGEHFSFVGVCFRAGLICGEHVSTNWQIRPWLSLSPRQIPAGHDALWPGHQLTW